jgi:putative endonuclease
MGAYLYILLCADGSYYVGITRDSLEKRISEHEPGTFGGYTARRRPVKLVFNQYFERVEDAIAAERQVKGWRRDKKEALIRAISPPCRHSLSLTSGVELLGWLGRYASFDCSLSSRSG